MHRKMLLDIGKSWWGMMVPGDTHRYVIKVVNMLPTKHDLREAPQRCWRGEAPESEDTRRQRCVSGGDEGVARTNVSREPRLTFSVNNIIYMHENASSGARNKVAGGERHLRWRSQDVSDVRLGMKHITREPFLRNT